MQASVDLVASGRDEKNAILAEDHADIEKFAASSRKLLATTIGDVNHFEQRVALDETRRAIQAMKKDLAEVQSGRERVLKLAVDGKDAEARAEAAKVRAIVDRVETAIDTIQADEERLGQQTSDDATAEYVKARNLMLTLLGVAVVLAVAVALVLTRVITTAVGRVAGAAQHIAGEDLPSLVRVAKALAAGDLTQDAAITAERIDVRGKDELGVMAGDFNSMIDGLRQTGAAFAEMSVGLRETIGQVQAAANGLAGTSDQLGQAATQTSGIVQHVTHAIQNVAAGSSETSRSAQTSNEAVEELSQAIEGIARGAAEQASQVQAVSAQARRADRRRD
jgi:methyl-accepting chemotaxis protein